MLSCVPAVSGPEMSPMEGQGNPLPVQPAPPAVGTQGAEAGRREYADVISLTTPRVDPIPVPIKDNHGMLQARLGTSADHFCTRENP